MRIFVIVVCYNPNFDLLLKNISAYQTSVEKIIIWDNTSPTIINDLKNNYFKNYLNIEYIANNNNLGISQALNYAWRYAKKNHYTAFMSMDQDSVWINFNDFLCLAEKKLKVETCILGPTINKENSQKSHALIPKNYIITSGMIIPIKILDAINGYPSEFFVDGIDIDICVKARQKGYNIFMAQGAYLKQQFGSNLKFKFICKTYSSSNYPPKRLYDIFRNHIIIYRRTHCFAVLKLIKGYFIVYIRAIILFEDNKIKKISAIFKGVFSGLMFKIH